jgi:hypothetical protein
VIDRDTAHRNMVLALKLAIASVAIFASVLILAVIVRYG